MENYRGSTIIDLDYAGIFCWNEFKLFDILETDMVVICLIVLVGC